MSHCFFLGQKVATKKTGFPVVGRIVGVMEAGLYMATQPGLRPRWDRLFPDWQKKTVIYVYFDPPILPLTREELVEHYEYAEEEKTEYEIDEEYAMVKPTRVVAYPVDDLEPFDDNEANLASKLEETFEKDKHG